ncbi:MAG TPA: DUF554 domain-containing protein [Firmicutes bacterium]|nr:DUF554 domain-containing protein [Bacillota bacterium]
MRGTLINIATVLVGSILGLTLKQRIPARLTNPVVQAIGLFTMVLGMNMAQGAKNLLVVLFSLVLGGVIGEFLDIEGRLDGLGRWFETRLQASGDGFNKGFIAASLLFCVGPMSIVGSIEDGLYGNYQILLTKSIMDGVCSIAFASTLGIGVPFSALVILFFQGGISLAASLVRPFMTDSVITAMTAVGGVMILGIGINLLELRKLKIANLLPALAVAVLLSAIWSS